MFAKLLKHEMKAHAPLFGVASAALMGLALLGGLLFRWTQSISELPGHEWVGAVIAPTLMLLIVGPIVFCVGNLVLLLVRFYKNKFTDEGYLTFTLPVNSHQIFLSSALSYLIWTVAAWLVLALYILLFAAVTDLTGLIESSADLGVMVATLVEALLAGRDFYSDYLWLYAVNILVELICSCIVPLACITVGCTIAKRHKVLASLGIYYGYSALTGYLSTITTVIFNLGMSESVELEEFAQLFAINLGVEALLTLIPAVGGYFLATYLMRRDLNLA